MTLTTTLLIFSGIAAIFYLVAAIQGSRTFLIPAGGTLILLGAMILSTPGITVPDGSTTFIGNVTGTINSTSFKNNENITTIQVENQTQRRINIDKNYSEFSPSQMLAIILIISGLMSMFLGANQKGNLLKVFKQRKPKTRQR